MEWIFFARSWKNHSDLVFPVFYDAVSVRFPEAYALAAWPVQKLGSLRLRRKAGLSSGGTQKRDGGRAGKDWSSLPLFLHALGEGKYELLSALQIKKAVEAGQLPKRAPLIVRTFPHRTIRSFTAKDVIHVLKSGGSGIERLTHAKLPSVKKRGLLSLPLGSEVLAKPSVQAPRPVPVRAGSEREPARLQPPRSRGWKTWLSSKLFFGVLLVYCVLGIGFSFFITGNPAPTVHGIGLGLGLALLKTVGVLFFIFMWAALALGRVESERLVISGAAMFALGTLLYATIGYRTGFEHIQNNQFASMMALVDRCMEEGIRRGKRIGAVCADGWRSQSTGWGTCSHHGGVRKWTYHEEQTRTLAECRSRAKHIRW